MTDFDPALHRMVPQQRWFEDFALGERFVIPSRTMTAAVEILARMLIGRSLSRLLKLSPPSFRDAPPGAGPESILPIVVMDSGLDARIAPE